MLEPHLPKKFLGRTGLEVTQLGFGAGQRLAREESFSCEQAGRLLNAVLDAGINFIDTAPDYGPSEAQIGRHLAARRDEFFLATKCGCNIDASGTRLDPDHLWTAERLHRNIDQSLLRLRTDHVDVLLTHNAAPNDLQNGVGEALQAIKAAGKTRFLGASTTSPHLPALARSGCFDVVQVPYSALERRHEEMMLAVAEMGIGVIVRGGIAVGHRAYGPIQETWDRSGLERFAEGMNRYEFLLRFTLAHPACHTTIVGTTNPKHLDSNVSAAHRGPLPPDLYARAKLLLDAAGEQPEQ